MSWKNAGKTMNTIEEWVVSPSETYSSEDLVQKVWLKYLSIESQDATNESDLLGISVYESQCEECDLYSHVRPSMV